jgi:hypothetical protein
MNLLVHTLNGINDNLRQASELHTRFEEIPNDAVWTPRPRKRSRRRQDKLAQIALEKALGESMVAEATM